MEEISPCSVRVPRIVDAIIFAAGVGENDVKMRERICREMEFLGIHLDREKNKQTANGLREINTCDSPVKILVIPTNEELEIAKQCHALLTSRH